MSFVTTTPTVLTTAATTVQQMADYLRYITNATSQHTINAAGPAIDEVSMRAAARLTAHAKQHQAIMTEALTVLHGFMDALRAGAAEYSATEAGNVRTCH